MASFAKRIARASSDAVYYIEETGGGEIAMYSCLLAVADHKRAAFERAMQEKRTLRAEDFGRVIYYGAGMLTDRAIDEILAEKN